MLGMRRRRAGSRAKLLIGAFGSVTLLTALIQLWLTLQSRRCSQWLESAPGGAKDGWEASMLDRVWGGLDNSAAACLGPTFLSLEHTHEKGEETIRLQSSCAQGGRYTFTYTNNPSLQFAFPLEGTVILSNRTTGNLLEDTTELSESTPLGPREFVRTICPSIPHFPSPLPWSNIHSIVSSLSITPLES